MLDIRTLERSKQDGRLELNRTIHLEYIRVWGFSPFLKPVIISGKLARLSDGYQFDYNADYTSALPCARCLTQLERGFSSSFSHFLREAQEDLLEEDFVPIVKEKLNLTELVGSDLILELENNPLCKPNCKGLCPACGVDRNSEDCGCKMTETHDPRFDVLRELLGKKRPD